MKILVQIILKIQVLIVIVLVETIKIINPMLAIIRNRKEILNRFNWILLIIKLNNVIIYNAFLKIWNLTIKSSVGSWFRNKKSLIKKNNILIKLINRC